MPKQKWSELSQAQKIGFVALATVEVVLTTVALTDLARRPAAQVRGPKVAWALACFVQPVGPITYLTAGRLPAQ